MNDTSISFLDKLENIATAAWEHVPEATAMLVIGVLVIELIVRIISGLLNVAERKVALRKLIRTLFRIFLYTVLFISVLQSLGLDGVLSSLAGSTVVLALLLSTGVAPLITDMLSGLFLGSDRDFQPGARVKAGDKEAEGVIETMSLRKTYIRDKHDDIHVLPNSVVEKNEWVILEKSPLSKAQRARKLKKKRKSA